MLAAAGSEQACMHHRHHQPARPAVPANRYIPGQASCQQSAVACRAIQAPSLALSPGATLESAPAHAEDRVDTYVNLDAADFRCERE